jgi:hypothetical protein
MSHRRWCINVAKEQAGCSATPFLLRISSTWMVVPQRITDLFATVSANEEMARTQDSI